MPKINCMTCLFTVGYYAVIVYICTKVKLTYFTELSLSELVDLLLALVHLFGIGGAAGGDGGCCTTGEDVLQLLQVYWSAFPSLPGPPLGDCTLSNWRLC